MSTRQSLPYVKGISILAAILFSAFHAAARQTEAIAVWAFPDMGVVTNETPVGLSAYHHSGIFKVVFSLDGKPLEAVSGERMNSLTGEYEYWVSINPADHAPHASHVKTLVAKVHPRDGSMATLTRKLHFLTAPRATIHIAGTGSDATGNGSSDHPYATIDRALDDCSGGEFIGVASGTYHQPIRRLRERISSFVTIKPDGSGTVVLASGGALRQPYLAFQDIVFDIRPAFSGRCATFHSTHHIRFSGCTFKGPGKHFRNRVKGISAYGGARHLTVENSLFDGCAKAVHASGLGSHIIRGNTITNDVEDVFVYSGNGIFISGNNVTVTPPGPAYIESGNVQPFNVSSSKGFTVCHKLNAGGTWTAHDFRDLGAKAADASAATAEEIAETMNLNPEFTKELYAKAVGGKLQVVGRRNNYVQFLYVTGEANDLLCFRETDPEKTAMAGGGHHPDFFQNFGDRHSGDDFTANVVVRNNMCRGDAQGGHLGEYTTMENVAYINNLIDTGSTWCLSWGSTKRLPSGTPVCSAVNGLVEFNTIIATNSFCVNRSIIEGGHRYKGNVFRNNVFVGKSSIDEAADDEFHMDFNLYQIRRDRTLGAHSLSADPLFVDAGIDFRLTENSPARNSASKTSGIIYDVNWNPRENTPDRGAFEYQPKQTRGDKQPGIMKELNK